MKKLPLFMSVAVGLLLTLFVLVGILANESTIDEVKKELNGDPYKIAQWLGRNIRTVKDSIGYSQPAKYTYRYKKGDCEDFAILARYFIGDRYETHLVVWTGKFREDSKFHKKYKEKKICHAVVAIKLYINNWGIIDQDKYIPNGRSLVDIIKINCDLRRIKVIRAYIADLYRFRNKIIKEIDLEE